MILRNATVSATIIIPLYFTNLNVLLVLQSVLYPDKLDDPS